MTISRWDYISNFNLDWLWPWATRKKMRFVRFAFIFPATKVFKPVAYTCGTSYRLWYDFALVNADVVPLDTKDMSFSVQIGNYTLPQHPRPMDVKVEIEHDFRRVINPGEVLGFAARGIGCGYRLSKGKDRCCHKQRSLPKQVKRWDGEEGTRSNYSHTFCGPRSVAALR